MASKTDPRITGVYAGVLSLVEVGLGSLLHGLKIPFAGTFLSLNQAFFLTRVIKLNRFNEGSKTLAFQISNIVSLLKSLSPAGKKLLPMLAISAQGLLFSVGTLFLGANLAGCLLGAALSSLWGVFQPLAVLWLIYGTAFGTEQMEKMLAYFTHLIGGYIDVTPHVLTSVVFSFAALKAAFALGLAWVGWQASFNEQDLLNQKFLQWGLRGLPNSSKKKEHNEHPAIAAFKELKRPIFLLSFLFTGVFFYFAEDSKARFIWQSLRPVAVAYLFFLAIRLFPLDSWIKKQGLGGSALASALEFIQNKARENENQD